MNYYKTYMKVTERLNQYYQNIISQVAEKTKSKIDRLHDWLYN